MSEKAFCETCRKMVDYSVEHEESEVTINHEKVTYNGTVARCVICHNEIFVDKLWQKDLDMIIRKYFGEENHEAKMDKS